jgi:hypothetical protein
MTSPIAEGVLAATHRLVQQAMSGQWQEVPKTVEERRVLLDKLSASASAQDRQWLSALKQAMAESDAAVASMTGQGLGARGAGPGSESAKLSPAPNSTVEVDTMMNMIRASKP